jgi:hypothetical protein
MIILLWLCAVLALLLWPFVIAINFSLTGSDAAGNGIADAMAFLSTLIVWSLLGLAVLLAAIRRRIPLWSFLLAVVLMPLSAAAALGVTDLLSQDVDVFWMTVIQIAVPPMLVFYLAWATVPSWHRAISTRIAAGFVWGSILVLSALPWPQVIGLPALQQKRVEAYAAQEQALTAQFTQLTAKASVHDWMHFLPAAENKHDDTVQQIRRLPDRQAEISKMLDAGDGSGFTALWELDLTLDPAFCQRARHFLQQQIPSFKPASTTAHYDDVRDAVEANEDTMIWLANNHCDIRPELDALETVLHSYPNGDQDAVLFLGTMDNMRHSLEK